MISFNLICSKGHEFGGWFPNSDSFEKQVKKKQIPCPDCGDTKVSKSIMAPTVTAKSAVKEKRTADAAKLRPRTLDPGAAFPRHHRKVRG